MPRKRTPALPDPKAAAPVPELTGPRLLLLGNLITPRALQVARHRLLYDHPRLDKWKKEEKTTLRVALILLLEMNPRAYITNEEKGLLAGRDADTIGEMTSRGEI